MQRLFVVASIFLSAATSGASVTSTTGGFVRPGQYTPVRVDGPSTLSGADLLTTITSVRGVVPVLVTGSATVLRYDGGSLPLIPLGPNDRLVASTVPMPPGLFGQNKIVPVRLDPTDPLPGPPAAWTGLDAVVFDGPSWGRVPEQTRDALRSAGVRITVVGGPPVAVPPPTSIDLISLDAYAPIRFRDGATPIAVRRTVLVILLLSSLAVVVLCVYVRRLWPVAAVSAAVVGGLFWYHARHGDQSRTVGDVFEIDGVVRRDEFVYDWSRDDARRSVPWTGDTRPIFRSRAAMAAADLRIVVDDAGTAFDFHAPAGSTLCFLHRTIEPSIEWSPVVGPSPLSDLVKQLYESPVLETVGRTAGSPWPGVALRRRS